MKETSQAELIMVFGDGIRACDEQALLTRSADHSWRVITLWPCVLIPLTLSLVAILIAWRRLCVEWLTYKPLVRKCTIIVLSLESFFGIACWVQCLTVVSATYFVGEVSACNVRCYSLDILGPLHKPFCGCAPSPLVCSFPRCFRVR